MLMFSRTPPTLFADPQLGALFILSPLDSLPGQFRAIAAALAYMVACFPLVQLDRGSIPGEVVNFNLKIFNLGVRRTGGVEMYNL